MHTVDFYHAGKRYRRRFASEEDADAFRAAVTQRPIAADSPGDIRHYLREYHQWSDLIRRKASKTVKGYAQMLNRFAEYCDSTGVRSVAQVTVGTVRGFQAAYFEQVKRSVDRRITNPAATWNHYRTALAAWANWGHARYPRIFRTNFAQAKDLKLPVKRKPPRYLTPDELGTILAYFDSQPNPGIFPAFFRVLIYTGMRLGEAVQLRWDQIDLKSKIITLPAIKTDEPRRIPIAAELGNFLTALPVTGPLVFGGDRPAYAFIGRYYWNFRQALAATGVRHARVHDLRHTWAMMFLQNGGDLQTCSKMLGHADIRTTMRYADYLDIDRARRVVDAITLTKSCPPIAQTVAQPLPKTPKKAHVRLSDETGTKRRKSLKSA